MANATARVSGYVLRATNRTGVSKTTGDPWSMTTVLVLVGNQGVSEVTLPRDWATPSSGDPVDYLVEARVYNGAVSFTALDDYPVEVAA